MTEHNELLVRVNSELLSSEANRNTACVLLSTYNGEKYIHDQIASIASQSGVDVALTIRDDGSQDGSVAQARLVAAKYNLPCEIIEGNNIGFLNSFEELLLNAQGFQYYAFSDQDDVWQPEKLSKAIAVLQDSGDSPAVYASSVLITDEKLRQIARNDFPSFIYSVPSEFVRHRLAGHTMVWNEALQRRIRNIGKLSVWSHDQHILLLALLHSAKLYLDSCSYVFHRRLPSSVTPGGGSPIKRLKHEIAMIANDGRFNRIALAEELLSLNGVDLTEDDKNFLQSVSVNNKTVMQRIKLSFSRNMHCGICIGDYEARLSVMLGRF